VKERYYTGDPSVDERIILRWIFRKWDVAVRTGSSWLRIGTGGVKPNPQNIHFRRRKKRRQMLVETASASPKSLTQR